jgi:hypothetical protein
MKILISFLVALSFALAAAPLDAKECKWNLPWNKACRAKRIEKDSTGGYSEAQRDPHARKEKADESKTKSGYYNGTYHNKGRNFRQKEYQFVDDAN